MNIGRRAGAGFEFIGRIDDVRIADHALTQDQIQTDMVTPLGGAAPGPDTTAPVVNLTAPTTSPVPGTVTVSATASDNVGRRWRAVPARQCAARRRGHDLALQRLVEHDHGVRRRRTR